MRKTLLLFGIILLLQYSNGRLHRAPYPGGSDSLYEMNSEEKDLNDEEKFRRFVSIEIIELFLNFFSKARNLIYMGIEEAEMYIKSFGENAYLQQGISELNEYKSKLRQRPPPGDLNYLYNLKSDIEGLMRKYDLLNIAVPNEADRIFHQAMSIEYWDIQFQTEAKAFFKKFKEVADTYWNTLSDEEQYEAQHFKNWLARFNESHYVAEKFDMFKEFFQIFEYEFYDDDKYKGRPRHLKHSSIF